MHASFTACNDACGHEQRQTLEPKTSSLGFTMAELPRLNHLVRLANPAADDADRVFQSDTRNRSRQELGNEHKRPLLHTAGALGFKVPGTGDRQVRAGRMTNHQVPAIANHIENVALVVQASHLSRQKVAAHGLMTLGNEGIPDDAREFTRDKYIHTHVSIAARRNSSGAPLALGSPAASPCARTTKSRRINAADMMARLRLGIVPKYLLMSAGEQAARSAKA